MRILTLGSLLRLVTLALSSSFAVASEPWQSQGPTGSSFHGLTQTPVGPGSGSRIFQPASGILLDKSAGRLLDTQTERPGVHERRKT